MGLKLGNEESKSAKSGEESLDDGEMDVRSVVEGQETQCGFAVF